MERPPLTKRFIADSMLGRLARWLRIIGYDTTYYNDIRDDTLIEKSLIEGRRLITRDTLLIRRRFISDYTFIRDDNPMDQLSQIVTDLNLNIGENLLTRCLECNTSLISTCREKIMGTVPEYIYSTIKEFFLCPSCNRVYWRGSHINRIRERLMQLFPERWEKL